MTPQEQEDLARDIHAFLRPPPNRDVVGQIVEQSFEADPRALLCFREDRTLEILRLAEGVKRPPLWQMMKLRIEGRRVQSFERVA